MVSQGPDLGCLRHTYTPLLNQKPLHKALSTGIWLMVSDQLGKYVYNQYRIHMCVCVCVCLTEILTQVRAELSLLCRSQPWVGTYICASPPERLQQS